MDQTHWRSQVVRLVDVQQQLAALDGPIQTYTYHRPRQAASKEELRDFERRLLRASLPTEYRNFLSIADGWVSFWQNADLFGLLELTGNGSGARGQELLEHHMTVPEIWATFAPDEVMPIGAARDVLDLFVLGRAEGPTGRTGGVARRRDHRALPRFRRVFDYIISCMSGEGIANSPERRACPSK